jgi:hypothetical protein
MNVHDIMHSRWVQASETFLEHTAAVVLGFVLIILGLGMGVTMVMLPVGIVIGLLGVAILIGGLFVRSDGKS